MLYEPSHRFGNKKPALKAPVLVQLDGYHSPSSIALLRTAPLSALVASRA